jgi:hypothetical protein
MLRSLRHALVVNCERRIVLAVIPSDSEFDIAAWSGAILGLLFNGCSSAEQKAQWVAGPRWSDFENLSAYNILGHERVAFHAFL